MKKVLWVSRHEMTPEQRADLDRIMGGAQLLPWQETVTDVARLAPLVRRADAVAAVLPPELLEKLLALAQGALRVLKGEEKAQEYRRPRPEDNN